MAHCPFGGFPGRKAVGALVSYRRPPAVRRIYFSGIPKPFYACLGNFCEKQRVQSTANETDVMA
jgi:hypothetical protein